MAQGVNEYLEELAGLLRTVIVNAFAKIGRLEFTEAPALERKDIIEYNRKMRASGIERFNNAAFVAAVNFYKTPRDKEQHNAVGAVILYLRASSVEAVLKGAGIRGFDEDDEEAVAGKYAEFSSAIADAFKAALASAGYQDLVLSDPVVARNSLMQGVEFSFDQYDRYEISCVYKKEKVLVADLTMAAIARR